MDQAEAKFDEVARGTLLERAQVLRYEARDSANADERVRLLGQARSLEREAGVQGCG